MMIPPSTKIHHYDQTSKDMDEKIKAVVDGQISTIFQPANLNQSRPNCMVVTKSGQQCNNNNGPLAHSSVGEQYWGIVKWIRILGSTPITFRSEGIWSRKIFYFHWTSRSNILPFVSAIFVIFLWTKYFAELVFNIPFIDGSYRSSKENFYKLIGLHQSDPKNYDGRGQTGLVKPSHVSVLIFSSIPFMEVFSLLCSWWTSGEIAKFLTNWDDIELDFRAAFDRDYNRDPRFIDLTRWRNKLILYYVAIPCLIIIPSYVHYNVHYDRPWMIIFMFLLCISFFLIPLMEDAKTIFTLKIVAEAFHQTKVQISSRIKDCQRSRTRVTGEGRLSADEIDLWRRLVINIRRECKSAGQFLKCSQLCHLAGSILVITCTTFVILTGDYSNEEVARSAIVCVGFVGLLVTQICVKTIVADQITEREKEIAEELDWIRRPIANAEALTEAKFIHDLILMDPARVTLGNYVCLSKRLLLSISSQVVTYIIVLLQLTQK